MIACQTLYMKNLLILVLKTALKSLRFYDEICIINFRKKNIYQFHCKNDNSQPIVVASSIKLTDYSVKEMKVDKMSKSE